MPINFDGLPVETQKLLAERYGIKQRHGLRSFGLTQVLFGLALVSLIIISLNWLVSTAWHYANPEYRATLIKFSPIDQRSLSLTFDLERRNPGAAFECTLVARDIDKNVVGELEFLVAPATQKILRSTATIPTRLAPVNGAVIECRRALDTAEK